MTLNCVAALLVQTHGMYAWSMYQSLGNICRQFWRSIRSVNRKGNFADACGHTASQKMVMCTIQADLDRVATAGGGRVDITVGSALDIFGGKLAYDDVVSWHRQNGL